MLKHIVMWKFKDQAAGADKLKNVAKAQVLLESCANVVPGLLKLEVAAAQGDMECTYDLVMYSEFVDAAALQAYQQHPQHVAIKPFIAAVRLERQCMDFEVASA
jgi:quinol monooxygenase YgiN